MQMTIGERTIKGLIKRREEAREIYKHARDKGQHVSLLEQERPNIFTQSVANIMPGDNIIITIRYVNILRYTQGHYELVFPMVVVPRYISEKVIKQFFQRVDRPALAHIEIDWGKLDVTKLYPAKVPDLWAGQPIRIHGRYTNGGEDTIVVRGQLANRPYKQKLRVKLPRNAPAHEAMATVWARQKVRQLMTKMVRAGQTKELVEEVTVPIVTPTYTRYKD